MRGSFFAVLAAAALLFGSRLAAQQTFDTPQDAANALVAAAGNNNTAALLRLLGPAGRDIVTSGDSSDDAADRTRFVMLAHEALRIEPEPSNPDRATVVVGKQDWPLPIPLVRANGKWHFDAARGNMEILARRIGRNELAVIDACRAFVEAEMEFAAKDHTPDKMLQYAPKIVSSPGKVDGLYTPNGKDNLVPEDFANAAATAYNVARHREPYHGYYFRILTAQGPNAEGGAMSYVVNRKMIGGFALLAYPAEYGVSGVKTFLVNYHGIVYEKDLGPNTVTLVPKITRFDPDKTWKPVRGE